jgi:hypothetical protein
VLRALRLLGAGAILLAVASACDVANVETPDPAAIPSGEPVAIGAEATGPVTELASGQDFDLGWRYVIYESADGWCTELQMVEVTSTGCGPDPLPAEGEHIGAVSVDEPLANGATPVTGIVSEEIVTVIIVDEVHGRLPALTLVPLDDAGLEGQAFVAFFPSEGTPTHVQAVALSGEILQTYEVP